MIRYEDAPGRSSSLDGDGDVDLGDFAILQQRIGDYGCGMSADLNEDGRVDLTDLDIMTQSFTGPS